MMSYKKNMIEGKVKRFCVLILLALLSSAVSAQKGKLSPWLRQISQRQRTAHSDARHLSSENNRRVCAFVRIASEADEVLRDNGCHELARCGNIYIADIPVSRLRPMAYDPRVMRIEARPNGQVLSDSMAYHLNALPVYAGEGLPQAYTGRGVVMGLMDIGFDLTHPAFFSQDGEDYRISAFWDQLSQDTVGSTLYVGRDYYGREQLLALGHARDGLDQSHGTGTLQIAAGVGAGTPYRGMAPESDICIVANAVSADVSLIDSADLYKYTFATDALGFNYIFDYAERMGMPCVISFSEGSGQDYWGYDQLYYEMLDSLTGPGRILVVAAGNNGMTKSWFSKPVGVFSEGTFLRCGSKTQVVTLKSAQPFTIRAVSYGDEPDTLLVDTRQVLASDDSLFTAERQLFNVEIEAYPSSYNPDETCYDFTVNTLRSVGGTPPFSLEVLGSEAEVEVYRVTGNFIENETLNPALCAGEYTRSILSPASAPCAICVGATSYRDSIMNIHGEWKKYWLGNSGVRAPFSSMGPTFDGRRKPDVMAPGNNVVQAISSYYVEHHPTTSELSWEKARIERNGRLYQWVSDAGTSSSAPAVGGAIALWLQACPTLSPDDVLAVMARTCRHNDPSLTYPNNEFGYGEMDVYAGLLDILGLSEIKAISSCQAQMQLIPRHGHQLQVILPYAVDDLLRLRLYNLDGKCVYTTHLPVHRQSHTVSVPVRLSGVYAVQVDGRASFCGSQLVRFSD